MIPILLVVAPLALGQAEPGPDPSLHRFALVAGSNDGGPDRPLLRYAASDARSVAAVLVDLGGVAPADRVILEDADVASIRAALATIAGGLARSEGRRREVVVYYSGHSDERGLLMRGERYAYADLRRDLDALEAEVRIAILDSCASGSLVLAKGGSFVQPFLVDESTSVSGHAFLTSSSADESSQETAAIGGSYFTHALVSGLRGAADVNHDHRVTLDEAYQFAFDETLARTETTRLGAQHPARDIHLTGAGNLVLTEVGSTASAISFGEDLQGRLYVRDEQDRLVAELYKPAGRPVQLGLPPGSYRIVLDRGGQMWEARIDLTEESVLTLGTSGLRAVRIGLGGTARGGDLRDRLISGQIWRFPGDAGRRHHAAFGLVESGAAALDGVSFGLIASRYDEGVAGFEYGSLVAASGPLDGVQASFGASVAGDLDGWQMGGMVGVTRDLRGLQTAMAVNAARDVRGVQLGLVNVGRDVRGVQIGLVNVARTGRGLPIGLVNAVGDGMMHAEVWAGDLAPMNLGFKSGTRHAYSLVSIGYDPGDPIGLTNVGGAVGMRIGGGRPAVDLDAYCAAHFPAAFHGETVVATPQVRAALSFRIREHLSPFAGVSLGSQWSMQDPAARVSAMPALHLPVGEGVLLLWPGWSAGMRF